MEFTTRNANGYTVIEMPNVVNYEVNVSLKATLEAVCEGDEPRVAIDLSGVSFIGSLGVGLLAFAKKLVEHAGGTFCIIGPTDNVLRVMRKLKLDELFVIHSDESKLS